MALSTRCLRRIAGTIPTSKFFNPLRATVPSFAIDSNTYFASRCFSCGIHSNMRENMESKEDANVKNPSNFKKIQHGVPKDLIGKVLGREKQTVNEIKALSGTVIRLKKYYDAHDDPGKGYFVIGGSDEQIKKAIELIDERVSTKAPTGINDEDDRPLWASYRRNFKGQLPPQKTRKKCIRPTGNAGNPCPLCKLKIEQDRDYDYKDVGLIKQFICPHTWNILQPSTTGLCRTQQQKLEAEITKSRAYGLLPFTITVPDDSPIPYKPAGIPRETARIRY